MKIITTALFDIICGITLGFCLVAALSSFVNGNMISGCLFATSATISFSALVERFKGTMKW